MSNETLNFCFGLCIGIIGAVFVMLYVAGEVNAHTNQKWREEAVERGHAEFYTDPETHARKWRWTK